MSLCARTDTASTLNVGALVQLDEIGDRGDLRSNYSSRNACNPPAYRQRTRAVGTTLRRSAGALNRSANGRQSPQNR